MELFDFEEDPNEIHNQINNEDYYKIEAELRIILSQRHKQCEIIPTDYKQAPTENVKRGYNQI